VDLLAQLSVPRHPDDPKAQYDSVGWIVLLFRFSLDCTITLTISADSSFGEVAAGNSAARLREPIPDLFEGTTVHEDEAKWVRDNWYSSLSLSDNPALNIRRAGAL
jgi:hypothetical protein